MRRIIFYALIAAFCLSLLIMGGCGKSRTAAVPRPEGTLGVAGFTNPIYNWQILAGYLQEEGNPAPDGTVETLDQLLLNTLHKHQVFDFVTPLAVEQCEKVVVFEEDGMPKVSAIKYWLEVGKCAQVDFLLVPQITYWRERVGGEGGVQTPAAIGLDFYLIDVKNEAIKRARYEEEQVSLLENLFTARKFADRDGKWVTASRLASEGIEEKLMELGL